MGRIMEGRPLCRPQILGTVAAPLSWGVFGTEHGDRAPWLHTFEKTYRAGLACLFGPEVFLTGASSCGATSHSGVGSVRRSVIEPFGDIF